MLKVIHVLNVAKKSGSLLLKNFWQMGIFLLFCRHFEKFLTNGNSHMQAFDVVKRDSSVRSVAGIDSHQHWLDYWLMLMHHQQTPVRSKQHPQIMAPTVMSQHNWRKKIANFVKRTGGFQMSLVAWKKYAITSSTLCLTWTVMKHIKVKLALHQGQLALCNC